MLSRTPTKAEKIYMEFAVKFGCVACHKLGRETEGLEAFTSFHHNPKKGSKKPLAHFFGFGLCAYHHQGVIPAGCEDPKEPVRHAKTTEETFTEAFGNDLTCACYVWKKMSLDELDSIGNINGIYSFGELLHKDGVLRNQE